MTACNGWLWFGEFGTNRAKSSGDTAARFIALPYLPLYRATNDGDLHAAGGATRIAYGTR